MIPSEVCSIRGLSPLSRQTPYTLPIRVYKSREPRMMPWIAFVGHFVPHTMRSFDSWDQAMAWAVSSGQVIRRQMAQRAYPVQVHRSLAADRDAGIAGKYRPGYGL